MSLIDDNRKYEDWLRRQCDVVEADLDKKHERMRESPFFFLRATYFRWAKRIEKICPALEKTPPVLTVGDLHLENYGTWRDAEGRLVWGVNDFDEAAIIPYAFDLVRLATSARLAPGLPIGNRTVAKAILDGYELGLEKPRPTLLDEQERWMRPYVAVTDGEREKFWDEINHLSLATPPAEAQAALTSVGLPTGTRRVRYASRVAGGGSLGRPRYVAVAEWNGGRIFREAKALVTSAWGWAHKDDTAQSHFLDVANGRFRSPDPFLHVQNKFIVRRIAADSRKIDFGDHIDPAKAERVIAAMGFDLGAIHAAGSGAASQIQHDLKGRSGHDWLHDAARAAAAAVEADYREWCRRGPATT